MALRVEISPLEEVLQIIRSGACAAVQFSSEITVRPADVATGLRGSGIRLFCAGKPHDLTTFLEQINTSAGLAAGAGRDAAFAALAGEAPGKAGTALLVTDAHTLSSETTLQFVAEVMLAQPRLCVVLVGRPGLREVLQKDLMAPVRARFARGPAMDTQEPSEPAARAGSRWLVAGGALVAGSLATLAIGVGVGVVPWPGAKTPDAGVKVAKAQAMPPAVIAPVAPRPSAAPAVAMKMAVVQPPSTPKPKVVEAAPVADLQTIMLRGGTFRMGSQTDRSELPVHTVAVAPFALSVHAVTIGDWRVCAAAGACVTVDGAADAPVGNVSWDDAVRYAGWLSRATGHQYRLPTEAEWEYAARAGSVSRYAWGEAMIAGKAACKGCNEGTDTDHAPAVTAFPANGFGLFGLGGGVAEWVQDCWHKTYIGAPAVAARAWDLPGCSERVLRGGSWQNEAADIRPASRDSYDASVRYPTHGFRLVREDTAAVPTNRRPT